MRTILFFLAIGLVVASMCIGLTAGSVQGPKAHPDSPVRNIVYAHVPSSICALLCFCVLLVAAIGYLKTSKESWDRLAIAAAEVGTVFAIVMNATGCIFSHAEWNTWWTPSPRLISAAMLLFLYIVYLILRSSLSGAKQRIARNSSVFAIIAFLNVPMVIISARFMPDIHKASFEFGSNWQRVAFFLGMISTCFLAGLLMWFRTDILSTRARLEREFVN
ncbi:MAG: cytochrome c biogenesis protein CcsA [Anaerohalosphaera sp.]|nr:cytochrome c biogenesis protein CcsA [Anaerohalosphaera sp.]